MSKKYRFFDDEFDDESSLEENDEVQLYSNKCLSKREETGYEDRKNNALIARSILHCDVDCFYCQCESLLDDAKSDDDPSKLFLSNRPFAIGQKHIIVTSNYIARDLGVTKLMTKEAALYACPNLIIVDGSDLTLYRRGSRKIYLSFRNALNRIKSNSKGGYTASKGGFDEMYADVTGLIGNTYSSKENTSFTDNKLIDRSLFVFGDNDSDVSLSEDQSGACVTISVKSNSMKDTEGFQDDNLQKWGSLSERQICVRRLREASSIARFVQQHVKEATGFTISIGVSVSRFLAKLSSDLKKPNSVNILFPWRTTRLIESMPLRKIPGVGSRTIKHIRACFESQKIPGLATTTLLTCRNFLTIPRSEIEAMCRNSQEKERSEHESVSFIYERCNGIDDTQVIDDGGKLPKIVSVENSHRRRTLTTNLLHASLKNLSERLMALINERIEESVSSQVSYPKTMRLSIVDVKDGSRKRRSKQKPFNGKKLLSIKEITNQFDFIYKESMFLLQSLLCNVSCASIINLNIGVCNFTDAPPHQSMICSKSDPLPLLYQHLHSGVNKEVKVSSESNKDALQMKNQSAGDMGDLDHEVLSCIPQDIIDEAVEAHRIHDEHHVKRHKIPPITNYFFRKR